MTGHACSLFADSMCVELEVKDQGSLCRCVCPPVMDIVVPCISISVQLLKVCRTAAWRVKRARSQQVWNALIDRSHVCLLCDEARSTRVWFQTAGLGYSEAKSRSSVRPDEGVGVRSSPERWRTHCAEASGRDQVFGPASNGDARSVGPTPFLSCACVRLLTLSGSRGCVC